MPTPEVLQCYIVLQYNEILEENQLNLQMWDFHGFSIAKV
jgi:hypothetical protein